MAAPAVGGRGSGEAGAEGQAVVAAGEWRFVAWVLPWWCGALGGRPFGRL
ncbi:hypothetical protein [Streptomyces cuspidosporus]